ncbi:MAG: type VI secretion system contractile sheath large subunit [Desulfobulbus sp.]
MAEELKAEEKGAETTESLSLIDDILSATKLTPENESYSVAKKGVEALIAQIFQPGKSVEKINSLICDEMIAELDKKMSRQLDEILHHPDYQKMESAWRSLKFIVDRTNFRENIKLEIMNLSKQDMLDDFSDAPEVVQSGLYKVAYSREYGQFGGQPYAAIIGNYEFGPGPQDIKLLQDLSAVSAMSHAPFISATSPEMFGIEDFSKLPDLKDLKAIFEGPQYARWQAFRGSEDSRYVGLTVPHFLLRLPYGPSSNPTKSFTYEESVSEGNDRFLWGNAAFAFATRLTESFANYRWCANIIGPQGGGTVENLELYQYESMGAIQTKIPTEIVITDRKEFELAEEGFIALTMRKGSNNAAFFSAQSCQKPKNFGISKEGKEAELNYKLGTQLPYMFVVNRLAHYIKVIQRENIGSFKERGELEAELNTWIGQYVVEMDNPTATTRAKKPLRSAQINVEDVEGEPGWYRVSMMVRPHFKYMGSSFTLSLVGKLDK